LAKHGLSGRDLVMSAHALLHAGSFVAMEKSIAPEKGAELYKSYTREQQANIDLIRAMMTPRK
jgi:precorrin-4 methylase